MQFSTIPVIILVCYMMAEIYKVIFKKNKKAYKLIPIFSALLGGLLGVLIYFTTPSLINTDNIWLSIEIGIVSGASATGANQIVKKIFINKGETNENLE